MKPVDLTALLQEFYRDKLTLTLRHQAGARLIPHYDYNNTYQYIIARELDHHLPWVRTALEERGAEAPTLDAPAAPPQRSGRDGWRDILGEDARHQGAFVEKWQPRLELLTHARHKAMLKVILGETIEHGRMFEQAAAGLDNLLGRKADGAGTRGAVMSARWIGD